MQVATFADHLKVSRVTLSRLLNGKSGISADMALRLSEALGTSPELWLNLQTQWDLWQARKEDAERFLCCKSSGWPAESSVAFFSRRPEFNRKTGLSWAYCPAGGVAFGSIPIFNTVSATRSAACRNTSPSAAKFPVMQRIPMRSMR